MLIFLAFKPFENDLSYYSDYDKNFYFILYIN